MIRNQRLVIALIFGVLFTSKSIAQFNYGEALQKSILFYETQQSGVLPDWNRISWRGDAGVNDGKDVGLDLTGGWFDAGDHIKFGFPMAFSVTALNWGFLEYKEGYDKVNQTEHFKRNIKWVTDYFIKCHPSKFEFYAQVSKKGQDHSYWMPAEMIDVHPQYGQRESFKLDTAHPGTEVVCETAAALASASIMFKDSDPAYSATLLQHAKELYEFGDTYRGKYTEEGGIPAVGTYSSGGYEDELSWGALWLYKATNDPAYLQKAIQHYGEPDYLWSFVWDDKRYGNMVLLAQITGEQQYKDHVERHLQFWVNNGNGITYSPGGQAHLTQWGSLRHSMNAALTALIYSDTVETPNKQQYQDFAISQIKYALGDNPNNRSLVTGFGVNPPTKPHHRGQHSSWSRSETVPAESRHTMWGALMGGPGNPDDAFAENRSDFQANEVACDYNACYQGVLAKMVMQFGGSELPNFPQVEASGDEFLNETKINAQSDKFTEIALWFNNRSAWPARIPGSLTARYFIDISEGIAAGYSAADYQVTGRGSGGAVGGLQVWDAANNIYFLEIAADSNDMPFPGGQGEYRKEVQVRISVPDQAQGSAWDPTNDFSYTGLSNGLIESQNIPIYANGKLVFGKEPAGGTLSTPDFRSIELAIFPVPVANMLNIKGKPAELDNANITIYGLAGNSINVPSNTSVGSGTITYNTSGLASGMYFVHLVTRDGRKVQTKFLKR